MGILPIVNVCRREGLRHNQGLEARATSEFTTKNTNDTKGEFAGMVAPRRAKSFPLLFRVILGRFQRGGS
jgi:hypothetical protein